MITGGGAIKKFFGSCTDLQMCYFPPGTPPGVVGSNTLEHQADYSSLIYAVSDALFFGFFFSNLNVCFKLQNREYMCGTQVSL